MGIIYTPALFRFLLLSENFTISKDCYTLLAGDILQMSYPTQSLRRWVIRAKQFLLKVFPTLLKIKPNAYVVLTASDKEFYNKVYSLSRVFISSLNSCRQVL